MLFFLRTRKGVGDGSDLARISSQQVYMAALVRTLQADGVLNDIRRLYGIASAASQTMVLSTSLSQLDVMVSMARALRGVPNENIVFIQYPALDADLFTLGHGSLGFGSTTEGNAGGSQASPPGKVEVLEGLVGQTAGDQTCAVPR